MKQRVKTARGKIIDMAALGAKNEHVRAVGNVLMNARGDRLNADGSVRVRAEDLARAAQNNKTPTQQTAISNPKPIVSNPAPVAPTQPPIVDDPQPISKITKTREDGSKYVEIEYDDGSIETQEVTE